jgi:hypothetical protein
LDIERKRILLAGRLGHGRSEFAFDEVRSVEFANDGLASMITFNTTNPSKPRYMVVFLLGDLGAGAWRAGLESILDLKPTVRVSP